ncbi:aminodeoxychorismate synthase component I [Halobacillus locisalis]|uniref:Aminodeoxychorismate synthase component I n=1 Tax=Halobacillus locisalis TaxID=220753 RepID=A0A838CTC2_9BACI|nr:aminodeoxychorismate synthase component I [Halobacillus locisalis]MBA2175069.1 aminodeoxychorismate synthase component I [Halobacillus locisalis]
MKEREVYLLFEFLDSEGVQEPHLFTKPEKILLADTLDEVQEVFREADEWLGQGYYVAGYVSYEAAPAFDTSFQVHSNPHWPLIWFGVFDRPVPYDSEKRKGGEFSTSDWTWKGDYHEYQNGIEEIKKAIERGDTYQVNYTTRLEADFSGDDWSFYKQLARNQQSSYSAYLQMGSRRLLSASPELFFRIDDGHVTTKPMKGTAKRGRFTEEDERYINHLRTSEKERAENLMIVDLLRNDVGRIAKAGTVRVPKLFEVETYPTVHQMTSTVQGELPEEFTMHNVFQALFPCGSITGAPKVRTMEYIQKLESSTREVYCGAIGFMTPNKEAVFNVPIRTVMIDQDEQKAVYGTGGGVTWDSTSEGEFEEIHTKARLLTEKRPDFHLLETMKLQDGAFPLLKQHLHRLEKSARYFARALDLKAIRGALETVAVSNGRGVHKVRLLVDELGEPTIETTPLDQTSKTVTCSLAHSPVNESDPFLFHKTTHRDVYDVHKNPSVYSVLLWNTQEELTEFTTGNLVVRIGDDYYTPPVSSGLLAGTRRQQLLDEGKVVEKVLYKEDLNRADDVWFINGLRGWLNVTFDHQEEEGIE